MSGPSSAPRDPAPLPLFFKEAPVIVSAEDHLRFGLLPTLDHAFAAHSNATPLGLSEFSLALRHYPIVFSSGEQPVPLAVTGLKEGSNLFVDPKGQWRPNHYLPGFVRRYPFMLQQSAQGEAMLAVDLGSGRFVPVAQDARAQALFDDEGNPTALTQAVMEFCRLVHMEQQKIQGFGQALVAHRLLVPNEAKFDFPDGSHYTLKGFRVIDEAAFRALPADILAQWTALGWTDVVALHFASRQNWQMLMDLHVQRVTSKA